MKKKREQLFEKNVSLADYSTFGIGGEAKAFIEVNTAEMMSSVLQVCSSERRPFLVLGKGSNILFDDKGFDGTVILNKIDFFKEEGALFHVGAGFSFSRLGTLVARKGWTGLEFAAGIPGSVGGAVYMNAGAGGQETATTLQSVDFIDIEGKQKRFAKEELEFSYRFSSFHRMKGAITGASFLLQPSAQARKEQIELIKYRKKTQPYGEMSAGCAFRNPTAGSAGALIEECGLKGFSIGAAKISTLHGNFVINKGKATSKEVLELLEHIRKVVKEKKNIDLQQEIRFIPQQTKEPEQKG